MAMTGDEFRTIALSFEGAAESAHFDRRAFKARRTFATLAADENSANILLTPHEQELYIEQRPDIFSRVPNKWGDHGWTTASLAEADAAIFSSALRTAWQAAARAKGRKRP